MATYYCTSAGAGTSAGDSWANAMPWATLKTTIAAGDVAYLGGTFANTTTADAFTNAGTNVAPIWLIGCSGSGVQTFPGDGYLGRGAGGAGALTTTNFAAFTYTSGTFTTKAYYFLLNISFTASSRSGVLLTTASPTAIINCYVTNSTNNASAAGITGASGDKYENCDIGATGAAGSAAINLSSGMVFDSRLTCPGGKGISIVTGTTGFVFGCQIYNCTNGIFAAGATATTNIVARWNTFYNCTTGFQLPNVSVTGISMASGNVITGGTTGFDSLYVATNPLCFLRYGNVIKNTTEETANAFTKTPAMYSITGLTSGGDFWNPSGNDYRLKSISPAFNKNLIGGDIGGVETDKKAWAKQQGLV